MRPVTRCCDSSVRGWLLNFAVATCSSASEGTSSWWWPLASTRPAPRRWQPGSVYSAKTRRVGVAAYDSVRDGPGRHRLEVVEQLRAGLARGELLLHYQPMLDLRDDRVTGVEALVRWQHPERGLLYPDAFIGLAESFGLMASLTHTVLAAALAQCRAWADAGEHLTVAVNVSPSNLVDEHFPDQVDALLVAHGLSPESLVLEVTESLLMEDRERAVSVLTRLRDAGVGVAIDDYGTGYSSLAYLPSCRSLSSSWTGPSSAR